MPAPSCDLLHEAGINRAKRLLIAIPEGFEAGLIVDQAKSICPNLSVMARAHSEEQCDHLLQHGADGDVQGENEIARQMLAARWCPYQQIALSKASARSGDPGKGRSTMRDRKKPPRWFHLSIWAGIAPAVIVPAGCIQKHGEVPGYTAIHPD